MRLLIHTTRHPGIFPSVQEETTHQSKRMVHVPRREIRALAIHIQEAIFGSGIEHGLPHGGVVRIGNVDDGELDWGRDVGHIADAGFQGRKRGGGRK